MAKAFELVEGIPFARIVYSLLLVVLIAMIGRELLSVWDRGKYYLSDFSYFESGTKKADYGEQLRRETIVDYAMILDLIKRYPPRVAPDDQFVSEDCERQTLWNRLSSEAGGYLRNAKKTIKRSAKWLRAKISGKPLEEDDDEEDTDSDSCRQRTIVRTTVDDILNNLQTEKLDKVANQLDVTVQGISLKALLATFGNLVYPKNTEITANIYAAQAPNKSRRTVLSVPGALKSRPGTSFDAAPRVFAIESDIDDAENAFRIACYLVWAQWDDRKAGADDDSRVAYDELCNWGRILTIKDALTLSTKYNLAEKKKTLKLDFLRKQYALAAQLDIGMHEIYAALAGMEDFVGDEKIALSGSTVASIQSLSDIIRYLALTKTTSREKSDSDEDWTKTIPQQPEPGAKEVNSSFFKHSLIPDNDPKFAKLGQSIAENAKNVVRIIRPVPTRGKSTTTNFITSGFVVETDTVISIAAGPVDPKRLDPYLQASVGSVSSFRPNEATFKVTKAEYVDQKAGTPFIRLTVPGLKRLGGKPVFDFSPLEESRNIVVAGHIRTTDLIFAGPKELRESDTGVFNNNITHVLRGRVTAPYYSDFIDDRERRFYLSTPFAAGLTGAPILNRSGNVIGFVESGAYIGKNLSLGVGISMATLKQNEWLGPFASED